jgi:hypothetical protein
VIWSISALAFGLQLLDPGSDHASHRLHGQLVDSGSQESFKPIDVAHLKRFRCLVHNGDCFFLLIICLVDVVLDIASLASAARLG